MTTPTISAAYSFGRRAFVMALYAVVYFLLLTGALRYGPAAFVQALMHSLIFLIAVFLTPAQSDGWFHGWKENLIVVMGFGIFWGMALLWTVAHTPLGPTPGWHHIGTWVACTVWIVAVPPLLLAGLKRLFLRPMNDLSSTVA